MDKPVTPQKGPYKIKVEKSKVYFWCACALSQKQPFCDGAHRKEGKFKSVKFLAMESEELDFCGCKMSDRPPFCDGTHSRTKF